MMAQVEGAMERCRRIELKAMRLKASATRLRCARLQLKKGRISNLAHFDYSVAGRRRRRQLSV
jgi:hypothetical protein